MTAETGDHLTGPARHDAGVPASTSGRTARARAAERKLRRRRGRWLSPLTRRILVLNLIPLGMLVGAILYMDEYRQRLIDAELDALTVQGEIFAGAVGESAVAPDGIGEQILIDDIAARIVRRLAGPTEFLAAPNTLRARLFSVGGDLVVDSRQLVGAGGVVSIKELPPIDEADISSFLFRIYDAIFDLIPYDRNLPVYQEAPIQFAFDYDEVMAAYEGEPVQRVRVRPSGELVLSVAIPVVALRKVVGVLLLSRDGSEIEASLRSVRIDILKIFALAIAVTVMLSFYLAGTIARPVRRLAAAAERVRHGQGRDVAIPDFRDRRDEIGDLSGSLRDMTQALYIRMDAIERFAADVAHEIKNPLASLRSAVETVTRVKDPERQARLMAIIEQDVRRLDRLITDISDASRLDAELSRTQAEPVDIGTMLDSLAEIYRAMHDAESDKPLVFTVRKPRGEALVVPGIETRMMQVMQNLIGNAISFSPRDGEIALTVTTNSEGLTVLVDDVGPGIPPGKEEKIFERFYSERPAGDDFGNNSGLGLNISKQIVEAQGGTLSAENRIAADGKVLGARFVVWLPFAA
ncbi:MAG: stimulus-sensing domain-containing protein [Alphaproteobacteria bacterium]